MKMEEHHNLSFSPSISCIAPLPIHKVPAQTGYYTVGSQYGLAPAQHHYGQTFAGVYDGHGPGYTRWTHCPHCKLDGGCTPAIWAWLGAISGAQPHTSQGRLLGRPHEPCWALPLWTVETVDPPCVLQAAAHVNMHMHT